MGWRNGEGEGGSGAWWEMEYDGAWMVVICSRSMVPYTRQDEKVRKKDRRRTKSADF